MSDQTYIRVFSVDDHPLLREGIAAIINNQPEKIPVVEDKQEILQLYFDARLCRRPALNAQARSLLIFIRPNGGSNEVADCSLFGVAIQHR